MIAFSLCYCNLSGNSFLILLWYAVMQLLGLLQIQFMQISRMSVSSSCAWEKINLRLYPSKKYTLAVRGGSFYWSRIHALFDGVLLHWQYTSLSTHIAISRSGLKSYSRVLTNTIFSQMESRLRFSSTTRDRHWPCNAIAGAPARGR